MSRRRPTIPFGATVDLLLSPPSLLVLAAVFAVISLVLRRTTLMRRRALARFARRVELPLPPEAARDRTAAALAERNLAVDLGAVLGVALAGLFGLLVDAPGALPGTTEAAREGTWVLVVAGAALAGAAGGAAWSGARHAGRSTSSPGPRVARPTASTATDYVAPAELWGARLAGLAPAVGLGIGLVIALFVDTVAPRELLNTGTILAAVIGVVALVAAELVERRLLDLPQVAGSPLELAWSDALRARTLRDVVTAPLAIGVYATFAMLTAASAGVRDGVIANGLIGLVGLGIIAAGVIGVASTASRPQRHFRRRLWPHVDHPVGDGSSR